MLRLTAGLMAILTTAAYGQTQSALSPGRPADVRQAGIVSVATENTIIITGSVLILIGGLIIAEKHTTAAPAATTTSP